MQEYELALHYFKSGDINKAKEVISKVITQNPVLIDPYFLDAAISASNSDYESVIKTCEKVLELDPGNIRANYNAAVASQKLNEQRDVMHYIDNILSIDSVNINALLLKMKTLYDMGLKGESVDLAITILADNKNNTEINNHIQEFIQSTKDEYYARDVYSGVLEINRNNILALYQLAKLSINHGNTRKINNLLGSLKEIDSVGTYSVVIEAMLLEASGNKQKCLDLLEAVSAEEKLINTDILMLLAKNYLDIGNYIKALSVYQTSIINNLNVAESYHNIGMIQDLLGDFNKSIEAYRSSLNINPESVPTLYNLALLSDKIGDKSNAAKYIERCLKLSSTNEIKETYINIIASLKFDELTAPALTFSMDVVNDDDVDTQRLSVLFTKILLDRSHCIKELVYAAVQNDKRQFWSLMNNNSDKVYNDALLQIYYLNMQVDDYQMELFSRMLREYLLKSYSSNINNTVIQDLSAALAIRCYINGYVFYADKDENNNVRYLIENITKQNNIENITLLCVIAMYMPLYELYEKYNIKINHNHKSCIYRRLVKLQYLDRLEENKIYKDIRVLSEITNEISQIVQNQYENNPYPVWQKLTRKKPRPLLEVISDLSPGVHSRNIKLSEPNILIAGCGTGSHVIQTAFRILYSSITAIDLSKRSMAFASRKVKEYGLDNIEFIQMDIHNVDQLGERYDIIESVGVLHHMQDILTGLRALVSCLQDDGFINLGLYSILGRRQVIHAKRLYDKKNRTISDNEIRSLRVEIMNSDDEKLVSNLSGFKDFYSLNECRDLLFHENEYNTDLNQLSVLLDEAGLQFIGFDFNDIHMLSRFRNLFPDVNSETNLQNWCVFEEKYPDTFSGMYVFWCQKKQ